MSKTKNKIIEASINLWSVNENSTLDEIAQSIGISRRTLHRHFDGRSDLVFQVLNKLVLDFLDSVETIILNNSDDILKKIKQLFFNDIRSSNKYLVYKKLLTTEYPEYAIENQDVIKLHGLYRKTFQQLKETNLLEEYVTTDWIEGFYSSVIETAIKRINNDIEEIAFIAWRSFWKGISK